MWESWRLLFFRHIIKAKRNSNRDVGKWTRVQIDSLESRMLLSAAAPVQAPVMGGLVMAGHFASESKKAAAVAAPASMIGTYSGFYNIYPDSGNVEMTITSVHKSAFSGILDFSSNDGTTVHGAFKSSMTRGLNFKFNFKVGKQTSIQCTGSYNVGGALTMMNVYVHGTRFGGAKMSPYVPGDFAVMRSN